MGRSMIWLILLAPLLMGMSKSCTVDMMKIGNALHAMGAAIAYEPTPTDVEAEHQAFMKLLEANQRATEEWMMRHSVPMGVTHE